MGIKSKYNKISMSEAQKMVKSKEQVFYLMHINWFTPRTGYSIIHGVDLEQENPDCSYVVVYGRVRWREANSIAALVLTPDDEKEV